MCFPLCRFRIIPCPQEKTETKTRKSSCAFCFLKNKQGRAPFLQILLWWGKDGAPSAVFEQKHGKSPSSFSSMIFGRLEGQCRQSELVDSEVRPSVGFSSNTYQLSDLGQVVAISLSLICLSCQKEIIILSSCSGGEE